MEKEFVTYEQAVKLKELGFDSPCFRYVYIENNKQTNEVKPRFSDNFNSSKLIVSIPLKQQVFRWFREKHNIDSHIEKYLSSEDAIEYFFMANDKESVNFDTYEESNFACINYLISLIEAKN